MRRGTGAGVLRQLSGEKIVDALFTAHPRTMSRAQIARDTGLSKPTVSALVADMESAGLVRVAHEGPESAGVGRPAAYYELVPLFRHSVVGDIGATKMFVGIADLFGNLISEREVETGHDASTALQRFIAAATEMRRSVDGTCSGVCVGVPGIYRRDQDRVDQALNLPGFDGLALRSFLAARMSGQTDIERTGTGQIHIEQIHIENDVNLAALGELTQMGAQRPDGDFAAISVGTGIGLGMVVGGDLYRGGTGSAGELGSLLLSSPAPGAAAVTLEDVAAAPSIRKLFGSAIEDGRDSSLSPSADTPEIFEAAAAGDEAALTVLDKVAAAMALAVSHLCLIADPSRVVFGGGVGSNPVFVEAVRERLGHLIDTAPTLTASTLGRRAALIGAVAISVRSAREFLVAETLGDRPT